MQITRQFTVLSLAALVATAGPSSWPSPTETSAAVAEQQALIRGSILQDRSQQYSIANARDLGLAGRTAFAVMNGGVDPVTSDCLCLRPGNLTLNGRGGLGRSSHSSSPRPGTVLLGIDTAAASSPAAGFGISATAALRLAEAAAATANLTLADSDYSRQTRQDLLPANLNYGDGAGQQFVAARQERYGILTTGTPAQSRIAFGGAAGPLKLGDRVQGAVELAKLEPVSMPGGTAATGFDLAAASPALAMLDNSSAILSLAAYPDTAGGEPASALIFAAVVTYDSRASQPTLFQNTLRFYAAMGGSDRVGGNSPQQPAAGGSGGGREPDAYESAFLIATLERPAANSASIGGGPAGEPAYGFKPFSSVAPLSIAPLLSTTPPVSVEMGLGSRASSAGNAAIASDNTSQVGVAPDEPAAVAGLVSFATESQAGGGKFANAALGTRSSRGGIVAPAEERVSELSLATVTALGHRGIAAQPEEPISSATLYARYESPSGGIAAKHDEPIGDRIIRTLASTCDGDSDRDSGRSHESDRERDDDTRVPAVHHDADLSVTPFAPAAAVPEPSTMVFAAMGVGLLLLSRMGRRRSNPR